jgi:mevalonate kinase
LRSGGLSSKVTASAPGKIIVTGEHFVVHGAYAVAASINKRAWVTVSDSGDGESSISSRGQTSRMDSEDRLFTATRSVARKILSEFGKPDRPFNISVESSIPAGSGLGSSAAVSVATAAALLRYLGYPVENQKLYEIALDGERQVHGNPSGIDIQASILGGIILFSKNSGAKPIHLDRNLRFLVVYSGRRRRTGELIAKVAQTKKDFPRFFDQLARSASFFSLEAVDAATSGDLPYLGAIMNVMQASLSWIGASNRTIDNLIENFQSEDVYGAKITGAGGGGSVIALPKPEKAEALLRSISNRYKYSFICTVPHDGLRIEET